jgi:hypothetical protein
MQVPVQALPGSSPLPSPDPGLFWLELFWLEPERSGRPPPHSYAKSAPQAIPGRAPAGCPLPESAQAASQALLKKRHCLHRRRSVDRPGFRNRPPKPRVEERASRWFAS